ncbi:MAG: YkgJ family cysteine cluster protein [Acidobacteria bacterium]|nr:YkgJ family cysteine cluster protein [Acidobacteriota bacterium]
MDEFRFECQPGCTSCCRQKGFVYLTEEDLRRAAARLGLTAAAFERSYVYRTRRQLRLRKPRGSECPFLEPQGCRIHPHKPTQCRVYPFWPELVEDRLRWCAAAEQCPGIGTGAVVHIGTALERSREMREAYPTMYPRQSTSHHRQ